MYVLLPIAICCLGTLKQGGGVGRDFRSPLRKLAAASSGCVTRQRRHSFLCQDEFITDKSTLEKVALSHFHFIFRNVVISSKLNGPGFLRLWPLGKKMHSHSHIKIWCYSAIDL